MDDLRKACENYYGAVTQIEQGLRAEVPEKPEALILTQQMRELERPLLDGGIADQPYIWMREYRVCVDTIALFETLRERNRIAQLANPIG